MGLFCRNVGLKLSAYSQNSCCLSTRFLFLFFPLFSVCHSAQLRRTALWMAHTYSLTHHCSSVIAQQCGSVTRTSDLVAVNLCYSQKQRLTPSKSNSFVTDHQHTHIRRDVVWRLWCVFLLLHLLIVQLCASMRSIYIKQVGEELDVLIVVSLSA